MPNAPSVLIFASFMLVRFLIALLLGAQVGLIFFLTPATHWLYLGPVAILLAALLLSLVFDPQVRQGRRSRERLGTVVWRVLLVIVAPVLAFAVLGALLPPIWFPAALMVFLETSLLVAFTVRGRVGWLAICSALIGWLEFGIVAVLATAVITAQEQDGNWGSHLLAGIAVDIVTGWILLGFGVAILGGHLGMLLRIWVVGQS